MTILPLITDNIYLSTGSIDITIDTDILKPKNIDTSKAEFIVEEIDTELEYL